jgi:hypothetical protein
MPLLLLSTWSISALLPPLRGLASASQRATSLASLVVTSGFRGSSVCTGGAGSWAPYGCPGGKTLDHRDSTFGAKGLSLGLFISLFLCVLPKTAYATVCYLTPLPLKIVPRPTPGAASCILR